MYSIVELTPESALRFERLAPFEVRHVLRDLAALPRVHAFGATLMQRPVGLALAVRGWAAEGSLGGTAPAAGTGRVIGLAVAQAYRRIGIGRELLAALETSLASAGVHSAVCNYALPAEGAVALEGVFRSAGWSAPEMTMLQCRAQHAILESPLMREQITLPPEYEIVDWVDLTSRERAHIRERQEREPWYPASLDPFHFEPDLEILNSLALRYHGEVVGWLITRRTSPLTMYYRCLFVRADLAKLGRGLALICEAIRRHHELVGSRPGFGEWSTPASLPPMIRFIRRHMAPFGTIVTEQRVMKKELAATERAVPPRTAHRDVARIEALSDAECETAVAEVRALRELWTARADPVAFHTLGAVARIDAFEGEPVYRSASKRTSAVLRKRLAWLYERTCAALAQTLRAPVQLHELWAPPAVHIHGPARGADLPLAPVHCDVEHQYLCPGVEHAERPVSFTLLLSPSDPEAGITIWDASYDETIGLDTEETSRLLDAVPKTLHRTAPGELFAHPSDCFHQITPLHNRDSGTERITLDGQAVFEDGIWRMFG